MTDKLSLNVESVITSINPTDLSIIGEVKSARQEDIDNAIKRAQNAYQSWKKLSYPARGEYLLRVKDLILDYLDEIVPLVTSEI